MPGANVLNRSAKFFCCLYIIFLLLGSGVYADEGTGDYLAPEAATRSMISNEMGSNEGSSVENSLYFGAANRVIPVNVPPGRVGLTPKIAMIYNSYQQNDWLGVGWDLNVGYIRRSTKLGLDYTSNNFEVSFDGAFLGLVPAPYWGANHFCAKIEEDFKKYHFLSVTNGWGVTDRSGLQYYYGTTAASRQDDPNDSNRVFKWCLDKIVDTNGNYITFSYTKDQGQIYLARIEYTGNEGAIFQDPTNFIVFHLEDDRPDKKIMYTANFRVVTDKRLDFIEVKNTTDTIAVYDLTYAQSPNSKQSILSSVQQFGHDSKVLSDGTIQYGASLPETGFLYTNQAINFQFKDEPLYYEEVDDNPSQFITGDFDGNGLTDIYFIWMNNTNFGGRIRLYLSNGDGTFQYFNNPIDHELIDDYPTHISVGDYNGDGLSDVYFTWSQNEHFGGRNRLFLSNGDGTFQFLNNPIAYEEIDDYPTRVLVGDFDGNGLSDVYFIWSDNNHFGGRNRLYLSNGDGTFRYFNNPIDHEQIDDYPIRVFVGDFDGNGLSDVYFFWNDGIKNRLYLSNGNGTFTYINQAIPENEFDNNLNNLFLGDFNGDGRSDVYYIVNTTGTNRLCLSDGKGRFECFSDPIPPDQAKVSKGHVFLDDFNGDHLSDVYLFWNSWEESRLCLSNGNGGFECLNNPVPQDQMDTSLVNSVSGDFNGDGFSDMFFVNYSSGNNQLYFSNGDDRNLLSQIHENNVVTSIDYTPSSVCENTHLPFVVNLVSKIELKENDILLASKTYEYEGGQYDYLTRDFRGFAKMIQTNANATTIEKYFYQDEFRKGRIYQEDLRGPSPGGGQAGNLLTHGTIDWEVDYIDAPGNTVGFVKQIKRRIEYDGNPGFFTQDDYTYDIDLDGPGANTAGLLRQDLKTGTGAENITHAMTYTILGDWLWRIESNSITGSTSGKVRETTYDYYPDTTGNLRYETHWYSANEDENPSIEYRYDDFGNIIAKIDARQNTTTIAYETETHTFPDTITYPATNGIAHVEKYQAYDYRYGKPTRSLDQNEQLILKTYDEFGRLKKAEFPDGGQTEYTYNDTSFPRSIFTNQKESEASDIETATYFDGLGRKIQTASERENPDQPGSGSIITQWTYDDMGRLEKVTGPFFGSGSLSEYAQEPAGDYYYQKTEFDLRNRPSTVTRPDGQNGPSTTEYTYNGFSTTMTDPDQYVKTETTDHLGRIVEVVEDPGGVDAHTTYIYNAAGDLLEVHNPYWTGSDPDRNRIKITYDTLGRKTGMNDPDMGTWSYTYDPNGNLTEQIDAKGQSISMRYDELNRVTEKNYSSSSDNTVTYTYDLAENGVGYSYATGNNDVTTTVTAYDEMGRKTEEQKAIIGTATRTMAWNYDCTGRVQRLTYPHTDASPVFYVDYAFYPGTNLLHTTTGSDGTVYATLAVYQPSGKIGNLDFGNNVRTSYGYDGGSQRLTSIYTAKNQGTGNKHQDRRYYYTRAGDIEQIDDQTWVETYYYSYDKLHRLTSETTSTGSLGVNPGIFDMQYNDPDHLHAASQVTTRGATYDYTYDPNGNMTAGPDLTDLLAVGQRSLTFNADNMPTTVAHPTGSTVTLTYDGESQRAKKTGPNGTTYYFSNEFEQIGATSTCYIFAGNLRVAMVKDYSSVVYFHKDHLGSSSVITDTDGDALEKTKYMPFGGKRGDGPGIVSTAYKFTDQELDAESGLYNYDARLYDPIVGKFASADSVVPDFYNSQQLNRYLYCL